jgi:MFS family permease
MVSFSFQNDLNKCNSLILSVVGKRSFIMLLAGRFIVGMGIGVASNIVPVYIAEIAPPQSRYMRNTIIISTGRFQTLLSECL